MSSKIRAIDLYRKILRAHKYLPQDLRVIGNSYVRNEFHLHKKVESPKEMSIFFEAWEKYLAQISQSKHFYGQDMKQESKLLTPEQVEKLEELKKEAQRRP